MPSPTAPPAYDVAILGSGLGGSMLGAILARNGARVVLIDAASHPRFAVGESTIPYTLVALRSLAARFDVPEILGITTLENCTRTIAPSFGRKAHFGFLLHREGEEQNPEEVTQFGTPKILHEAHHLYRQDSDSYMFRVAVEHGCVPRQNHRITGFAFDDDGVTLTGADGSEIRTRYVVDAGGFRSPLAGELGLREEPCRFTHHSRSLWTHAVDVTETDDLWDRPKADTPPKPWYTGTVHHTFERGWFWVIGFDNTPMSRNPRCSIGLTLDPRRYPRDPDLTPAEDFAKHAAMFPDVERQYAGAVPVREWTSTGDRLQYSSSRTVGDRWCLLGHAAGFIDPLFSFGLGNTCDGVAALASRLLPALEEDDLSAERFEYVDRMQQAILDRNDQLVNAAYTSWQDHDLWTAVFRIWSWGSNAATYRLLGALTRFEAGETDAFDVLEDAPNLGLTWPDHDGFRALFDEMVDRVGAVERGEMEPRVAADALYRTLQRADFVLQPFGFSDRAKRFLSPTPATLLKSAWWAATKADPQVRGYLALTGKTAVKHALRGERVF